MAADAIDDPEILAFIEATLAAYGDLPAAPSVAEERAGYDRMCAAFRSERPAGLTVEDTTLTADAGPVSVRHYRPSGGVAHSEVVYYHGGGFTLGGLESHDDVCAEIAHAVGAPLWSVDYHLAPEHPHPAAYEDALGAARARLAHGDVVLVGDSAGGALAASVAVALRGEERVRGQVLIYPGLGGRRLGLASYRDRAEAPLLTVADVDRYDRLLTGGAPAVADPRRHALAATDLSGVASCFASAADVDPLRDDAVHYVERLADAGVPAEVSVEAQLPHGWLRARHRSARARAAFARIIDAIAARADLPRSASATTGVSVQ